MWLLRREDLFTRRKGVTTSFCRRPIGRWIVINHAAANFVEETVRTLLAIVLVLSTRLLTAQAGLEPRINAAVDRLKKDIPGLSIAVVADGRVVYAKGFGTISLTSHKRATPTTQYRLASVSKPITAVGILKLVESGQIDLDRPAKDYCPALAPLDGSPTVRHFLQHQSGMRHSTDAEDESITGPVPKLASSLETIVKEPLRFAPGRRTLYTSWGYTALGCLIETISGQAYADFIAEKVLAPASMRATSFDEPGYNTPDFSSGFRMAGGTFQPSVVVDARFKRPASGIISTVDDLGPIRDGALRTAFAVRAALSRDAVDTRGAGGSAHDVHGRMGRRAHEPWNTGVQLRRVDGRDDGVIGNCSGTSDGSRAIGEP